MGVGDRMFRGMAWSAIDRISVQAVQFAIGIILARILTPVEYGIIAILYVFIGLSQVFIDSGFSQALIQKKNRTNEDISTVFFFNIGISIVFYAILFLTAPFISSFYEIEELDILLKVLAISLIINAVYTIPATLYTIQMDFRSLTKINLISVVLSGLTAIYLAWDGFGVWALVIQAILRALIALIVIAIMIKWRPLLQFSVESFKKLFSFGSKLLVSSLLSNFFSHLNSLLIGKYIGAKELGFFTRGIQFSDVLYGIFSSVLNSVLLPGLSPIQDQKTVLIAHTRTIVKSSALVTVPIFLGLSIMSEPLILFLLTEKWLMAVPIMQIFCVARLVTIISGISVNLLYVIGRTDLALKQQYICIAIRVLFLLIALQYGIIYIALAELLSTILHFYINAFYPGKLMNYGALSQLKDISRILLSGILMLLPIYGLFLVIDSTLLRILIAPVVGVPTYMLGIYLFKIEEASMLMKKSKEFFSKDS